MKTGFKFGIAAVVLTACIAGSTLWKNAHSEDEAIKEAFIGSEMDKYYSADNICRQEYKEINEQRLRKDAKDVVYYKVDGGVLDCTCRHIKLSADGTSATMDVVCVSWGNWAIV